MVGVSSLRRSVMDAENWGLVEGMRRDVDAMIRPARGERSLLGRDFGSTSAVLLNRAAVAEQSRKSQFGHNPHRGLGINGVLRRGVFTPGPRLPDVPGPEALPERRSILGATPMSDLSTGERTRRLSGMGQRYGFNPVDPVSGQALNVGAEAGRSPVGREKLIAARVASGDLSVERAAEIGQQRQRHLDEQKERSQLRRDRGRALGSMRSGVMLDGRGGLGAIGSMMVRGANMGDPLRAAELGIQREQVQADAERRRADRELELERIEASRKRMATVAPDARVEAIRKGKSVYDVTEANRRADATSRLLAAGAEGELLLNMSRPRIKSDSAPSAVAEDFLDRLDEATSFSVGGLATLPPLELVREMLTVDGVGELGLRNLLTELERDLPTSLSGPDDPALRQWQYLSLIQRLLAE